MDREPIRVLLGAGESEAARLRGLLQGGGPPGFRVEHAGAIQDFLGRLGEASVDVAVLDLWLLEGEPGTAPAVREKAREVPLVALAGRPAQGGARAARDLGAQECLLREELSGPLLSRALAYAVERHRLRQELAAIRSRERCDGDFRALEGLTPVTAELYGAGRLRESLPGAFGEAVSAYGDILDHKLHEQAYRIGEEATDAVRALAEKLGFLRAGPQDAVDIHTEAVRAKLGASSRGRSAAYVDEGRFLLLELMGYLASYYRNYCAWGLAERGPNPAPTNEGGTDVG
jgi:hypothetical protein